MNPRTLLRPSQVAEILGVSIYVARERMKAGVIRSGRDDRGWYTTLARIDEFLATLPNTVEEKPALRIVSTRRMKAGWY